jgi:hypothetical protein
MFVVGARTVVENRLLSREITGFWAQRGVDIVRLDGDDAAIMTRSGSLPWRLIGDGRERQKILIARGAQKHPVRERFHAEAP